MESCAHIKSLIESTIERLFVSNTVTVKIVLYNHPKKDYISVESRQ